MKTTTIQYGRRSLSRSNHGYAILFAVIIIGIILTISLGLSNIAYKQIIVSSVARDSQLAFYESDSATDCALYSDFTSNAFNNPGSFPATITCGVDKNGVNYVLNVAHSTSTDGLTEIYDLTPQDPSWATRIEPCFMLSVLKTGGNTTVKAKGYNICDKTNPRAVEREIDIKY